MLNNLGRVADELLLLEEALARYAEAHELAERSGNIEGRALALGNMAII